MNGRDNRGRRRPFRGRHSERQDRQGGNAGDGKPRGDFQARKSADKPVGGKKSAASGRPNWTAPAQNTEPLPVLNCIRCGLPINDQHSAFSDRNNGQPVHFDCVMAELNEQEKLDEGDVLSYIGGGRFGIVHFNNGSGDKKFTIKRILEWENKDQRAQWRDVIADHYSIT